MTGIFMLCQKAEGASEPVNGRDHLCDHLCDHHFALCAFTLSFVCAVKGVLHLRPVFRTPSAVEDFTPHVATSPDDSPTSNFDIIDTRRFQGKRRTMSGSAVSVMYFQG